ncbi:MAG: hypothetical protein E7300_02285 [Lachnospiraceae bacterium]|nr:hypothetical protein [Lachnospiraceae bacterium]
MSLGAMWDAVGPNLTGVFQKACIQVIDLRELSESDTPQEEEGPSPLGGKKYSLNSSLSPSKMASHLDATDLTAAVKTAGGPFANQAAAITGTDAESIAEKQRLMKEEETAGYSSVGGASVKTFWLQFNPSELVLNAQGGGRVQKTSFADGSTGSGLQFAAADSRIDLGVKFYFDSMEPEDSFWSDYMATHGTSASAVAGKVTRKVAGKLRGRNKLTVQQKVEGFIAALRSKYTRWVTFSWGSMYYTGMVNELAANYTMFDHHGVPVRAEVQMQIVLIDQSAEPYRLGSWTDKYEEAFQDDLSLGNVGQKMLGGLVNLTH